MSARLIRTLILHYSLWSYIYSGYSGHSNIHLSIGSKTNWLGKQRLARTIFVRRKSSKFLRSTKFFWKFATRVVKKIGLISFSLSLSLLALYLLVSLVSSSSESVSLSGTTRILFFFLGIYTERYYRPVCCALLLPTCVIPVAVNLSFRVFCSVYIFAHRRYIYYYIYTTLLKKKKTESLVLYATRGVCAVCGRSWNFYPRDHRDHNGPPMRPRIHWENSRS